ncbi:MAG: phosphomannomutase/phosphoglucomutase [Candidatus Bathyarchaeia archaeon]
MFRAYDIRGVYGEDLTPKLGFDIGMAFAQLIGEGKRISVARDARLSGPIMESMFKLGVLASGCDTVELGLQPTPILYFSVAHLKLNGGCVTTASHNPPEYNGFKLCRKGGFSLTYESGIGEIEKLVTSRGTKYKRWNKLGKEEQCDIRPIYENYLREKIQLKRIMRVVVDAGNGTCGFMGEVLKRLGCKVDVLYGEPDGRFPHHVPNPLREETLTDLKKRVVEFDADLGIAFDGDGDRVGFIDDKGKMVKADHAMMIFAEDLIKRRGFLKSKILFDVATSRAVAEYVQQVGGSPKMTRVGHSYVMEALYEEGAAMAGEISGHYYFADDHYGFDDGLYAAARMVEILSHSESKLSEIIKGLPSYFSTPEERRKCPDERKFEVVEILKRKLTSMGYRIIDLDGVRVELEDAWALVRASNTEPAVVLRFEGETQEGLRNVKKLVEEALSAAYKEASAS